VVILTQIVYCVVFDVLRKRDPSPPFVEYNFFPSPRPPTFLPLGIPTPLSTLFLWKRSCLLIFFSSRARLGPFLSFLLWFLLFQLNDPHTYSVFYVAVPLLSIDLSHTSLCRAALASSFSSPFFFLEPLYSPPPHMYLIP